MTRWSGMRWFVVGLVVVLSGLAQGRALAQTSTSTDEVTFSQDIAPILQRSCQKCHRPNSLAPMSLISYEEVRPWARAIKYRTGLRDQMGVMPPWYIEKDIGIQRFENDSSLSDAEVALIAAWADAGAPQGDPADMPSPPPFIDVDEWEMGEPDLIVSSPSFEMDALAPDWWGNLGATPTGLTEDRYVAAIEYKEVTEARGEQTRTTVGGLFTVHHAAVISTDPDDDANPTTWPVHEVGRNYDVFDAEAGRLIKAGSRLVFFSTHLHSSGADTKGRLDVGLKLHPRGYEPTKDWQLLFFGNGADIDIPAMTADHRQGRVLHAARECEDQRLRAAYACAGRSDVPGCGLGQHGPDPQLRRLRPQLGPRLQVRRRRCPALAQRDDSAPDRLLQQLAVEPQRAGSPELVRGGASVRRQHVHQPDAGDLPHR